MLPRLSRPLPRLFLWLALLALSACGRSSSSTSGGAPSASVTPPVASVDPFDVANDAAEPTVALARDRGVAKGEAELRRTAFAARVNRADDRLREHPDAARSKALTESHQAMLEAYRAVQTSDETTFEAARRRFETASSRLDAQLVALGVPAAP